MMTNVCERALTFLCFLATALIIFSAVLASPTVLADSQTAVTGQGHVRGVVENGVVAFKGIPYAEPPVGELRFKAPRKAHTWHDGPIADRFPPICTQTRYEDGAAEVVGQEDCLYLNVYRPVDTGGDNAPVLVWIHGGGRRNGDGRRPVAYFVRETGTVVVMIQYRLDHLAFTAHPALSADNPERFSSGNYGYEDAIAALKWVRDEIANFGGDPNRVTIGGMSGGGTMVCGLLVSPKAAGLFHGAIIQSGGGCWFPTDSLSLAEQRGERLAETVGCAQATDVSACLRRVPAQAFFARPSLDNPFPANSVSFFAAMPMLGGRSGHFVDGYVFPRSFPQAFQQGVFHRVPLMIGVARHEGRRVYGDLLFQIGAGQMEEGDYRSALTGLLGSDSLAEKAARAFPVEGSGLSPIERFADVATLAHYTCPHAELALAASRYAPTWMYEQQVVGTKTNANITMGAYHGFDTELLFGGTFDGSKARFNEEQEKAAHLMRRYVANFVRRGDPNGPSTSHWRPYRGNDEEQHLAFSANPQMAVGLRQEACGFWRDEDWRRLPAIE